jgi:deazaflavin-dependent oxidoreductase (nitroreductase family)
MVIVADEAMSEERGFNQRNIDGRIYIVGSAAGRDSDPAWAFNLRAHPEAGVEIGTDPPRSVTARELPRPERDALYPVIVERAPGFAEYEKRTARVIPLFELLPA